MRASCAALRRICVVFGCVLAAGIAGCGFFFPSPAALEAAAEMPSLQSVRGDVLRIVKPDLPSQALDPATYFAASFAADPNSLPRPSFQVIEVDLTTGEVTPVAKTQDESEVFGPPVLRSERWSAQERMDGPGVVVTDEQTGEQRVWLDDLREGIGTSPAALDGDRLVVLLSRPTSGEQLLDVIDLAGGEQTIIDQVSPQAWSAVALSGDLLVFPAMPDFDPATQPLSEYLATDTLDVLDLSTGERRTILSDLGTLATGQVRFAGRRLMWLESRDTGHAVRSYDFDTQQAQTLLEVSNDAERAAFPWIIDFNERAALVEETLNTTEPGDIPNPFAFQQIVRYIVMPYDGDPVTLLEFKQDSMAPLPELQVLTDNYAAVLDRDFRTLVVHDLNTGQQRRITLFE